MRDRRRAWTTVLAAAAAIAAGAATTLAVRAADDEAAKKPAATGLDEAEGRALVQQLGDPDFAAREKAYARLREAGDGARRSLEEGANSSDAQVRWASGRLLRLLGGRGVEGDARPGLFAPPRAGSTRDEGEIDETMMARLREQMRLVERRMAEAEQRADRLFRDGAFPAEEDESSPPQLPVRRHGARIELSVGPDGKAKATVTRRGEDGKPTIETYEADTMEALRKQHPELFAGLRIDLRPGTGAQGDLPVLFRVPRGDLQREGERIFAALQDALPGGRRPVLGVSLSEVPAVLRTQLDIPAEEGIVVEEVREGSPAGRVGLQRHDVILRVNGLPVSTADDVRAAVSSVKEGGDVAVDVLRKGRRESLSGKK